jgi:hypothetical protein
VPSLPVLWTDPRFPASSRKSNLAVKKHDAGRNYVFKPFDASS